MNTYVQLDNLENKVISEHLDESLGKKKKKMKSVSILSERNVLGETQNC